MRSKLGRAVDGAARRKRHQTYPELVRARRCRLVEVGGRLGAEAATWLRMLAGQRTLETQAAARAPWVARWSGLLAVAAQRAIAESCWSSDSLASVTSPERRPS